MDMHAEDDEGTAKPPSSTLAALAEAQDIPYILEKIKS